MDPLYQELGTLTVSPTLFSDVGFFVSGKVDSRLIQLLENGGARQKLYATIGVTHFIVGDEADQNKIDEAKDIFDIPIVSPRWILYSVKEKKVLPVSGFSGEKGGLFSGLVFTTSRIGGDDLSSVWALVTYHKGKFIKHFTQRCTHLLTNETDSKKYFAAKKYLIPTICVDWLTDSIKAGKLLNVESYHPITKGRYGKGFPPRSPPSPIPHVPIKCSTSTSPVVQTGASKPKAPVAVSTTPAITSAISSVRTGQAEMKTESLPDWVTDVKQRMQKPAETSVITDHRNGTDSTPVPSQNYRSLTIESSNAKHESQASEELDQSKTGNGAGTPTRHSPEKAIPDPAPTANNTVIRNAPLQSQGTGPAETSSASVQDSRLFGNSEQMELINQVDPQIKLLLAQMDNSQRTLLIQKLAQKKREEKLRQEMMIRQQQMHRNHFQQQQNINSQGTKDGPTLADQSVNHSPQQQPQQQSPGASRLPMPQSPDGSQQPLQNIQFMRSRFPSPRPQGGFPVGLPNRQPIVMAEDFGKDVALMESQTQQKQQQVYAQQSVRPPQQSPMDQSTGQSPIRRQMPQTLFFSRGLSSSPTQRQLLVTQNQAGSVIRAEQSNFIEKSQQNPIPTSQQPQTRNQKVQAYLQNNIVSPPHQQEQQGGTAGPEHSPTRQQQQFYSPPHQLNPSQQQRFNVRHIVVQPGQNSQFLLDSQAPVSNHQVPTTSPAGNVQWSQPNRTQSPQQQQRLVSPPTGTLSPRQIRPGEPGPQQQHWTLRTPSPQQQQQGVIYTTQPNMPYAQVMNQKTKTALANLLSNRLMGSTTPEGPSPVSPFSLSCGVIGGTVVSRSPSPHAVASPSTINLPVQTRLSTGLAGQPPPQSLLQRRTLSNLTNSDKVPLSNNVPSSSRTVSQSPSPTYSSQSQQRFFGHDPSIKLPEDGFFLGCIFWAAQELRIKSWQKYVIKYGGMVESALSPRVTHVLCETQKFPEFQQCIREGKRLVTLFWLNDTISRRCLSSPLQAAHLPLPFTENERPYFGELISTSGFTGEEKERVHTMCTLLGLTVTPVFTRANIGLIAKSPEGEKFFKARQWKKPVVNIQFLNELLFGHTGVIPMIHSPKYQQFNMGAPFSFDVALVAPLMAPWKTPLRVSSDVIERFKSNKRPQESPPDNGSAKRLRLALGEDIGSLFPPQSPLSPIETPPGSTDAKIVENSFTSNSGVFILLSGFTESMKEVLAEKIKELGGRVTKDRHVATHLVVKENTLTKSLLTFLCIKDRIVRIEWLRDSYAGRKFLDVEPYLLTTAKSGIYDINYTEILKLPNRHRLFAGIVFWLTPSVGKDMKEIIEAAGGVFSHEKSLRVVYESALKSQDFVVVTCEEDEYLLNAWKHNDGVEKIVVVTRDTVLGWIVKQDVGCKDGTVQSTSKAPNPAPSIAPPNDLPMLPVEGRSENKMAALIPIGN